VIADRELRRLGLAESAVRLFGPLVRAVLTTALLALIAAQSIVCWKIAETTWAVRRLADFGVFYESAGQARAGGEPYARSSTPDGRPTRPPNLTPPHVVAAMVPLSLLPPAAALAVWCAASVLSALIALAIVFREARIRLSARSVLLTLAAIVCAAPTGALIFSAQITWLLWWPATLAWARARHGRWTTAAVLLGALASVKLFLGLFAVVFLLHRRWHDAALLIATAVVCLAAGWAVLGTDAVAGWVDALRAVSWAGHVWNGSVLGFVQRALIGAPHSAWTLAPVAVAPALVMPVWIILSGAILAIAARAVRQAPLTTALAVDRVFALTLTTSVLLSPLGWVYYDFLPAAPFVALAATPAWRTRGRIAALAFAAAALAATPGLLTAFQPDGVATITIGSLYFWSVVALWLASVVAGDGHAHARSAPVARVH
jgi:hypothetical protein